MHLSSRFKVKMFYYKSSLRPLPTERWEWFCTTTRSWSISLILTLRLVVVSLFDDPTKGAPVRMHSQTDDPVQWNVLSLNGVRILWRQCCHYYQSFARCSLLRNSKQWGFPTYLVINSSSSQVELGLLVSLTLNILISFFTLALLFPQLYLQLCQQNSIRIYFPCLLHHRFYSPLFLVLAYYVLVHFSCQ